MLKENNPCQILDLQYFLGRKWTIPLLLELKNNNVTFNQLKKRTNKTINSSLLSLTLKELIKFNIIQRINSEKIYYQLTDNGQELVDIFIQVKEWTVKNHINAKEQCTKFSCMECNYFLKDK